MVKRRTLSIEEVIADAPEQEEPPVVETFPRWKKIEWEQEQNFEYRMENHLTKSQVMDWLECPKKYYLKHIADEEYEETGYEAEMDYGRLIHQLYENFGNKTKHISEFKDEDNTTEIVETPNGTHYMVYRTPVTEEAKKALSFDQKNVGELDQQDHEHIIEYHFPEGSVFGIPERTIANIERRAPDMDEMEYEFTIREHIERLLKFESQRYQKTKETYGDAFNKTYDFHFESAETALINDSGVEAFLADDELEIYGFADRVARDPLGGGLCIIDLKVSFYKESDFGPIPRYPGVNGNGHRWEMVHYALCLEGNQWKPQYKDYEGRKFVEGGDLLDVTRTMVFSLDTPLEDDGVLVWNADDIKELEQTYDYMVQGILWLSDEPKDGKRFPCSCGEH